MDAEGRIYSAPEELVSAEDKARLEGYLRGREEEARLRELRERKERLLAELTEEPPGASRRIPER